MLLPEQGSLISRSPRVRAVLFWKVRFSRRGSMPYPALMRLNLINKAMSRTFLRILHFVLLVNEIHDVLVGCLVPPCVCGVQAVIGIVLNGPDL